ncbi:putative RNA polymerase II subunit B1 CTD phosphatase RPAP2 [Oopsacas minuta]|uniref:RNA polymerase II subunit B1 CTD phosphatase RPAP2 homolog n=1 Tax=Oopsacas minuta TaxID=111878 RepID=A0AAV7KKR2_9METZ|nr:putative RNA polymerase II subunit B1 CTD phosphatase RPAP2 [Oopsacas minuta]
MKKHKIEVIKKLRKDIEYKVSVEKKAFEMIVELVGEDFITESRLIQSIPLLNPGNYSDIIEERFSMKLCGYILCKNKLINIPKHRYHVSVKTKQVYDLSERKMFCCDQCYKASEFFACQLSNEPLWERNDITKTGIKFLKIDSGVEDDRISNENTDSEVREKLVEISVNNTAVKQSRKDFSKLFDTPEIQVSPVSQIPPLEECCKVVSTWLTNRTLDFLTKNIDIRDFFDGIPIFPKLTDQLKEHLSLKSYKYNSDSDDILSDDSLSDDEEFAPGNYLSNSTIEKMQAIYVKHTKSNTTPKGKLPAMNSLVTKSVPEIEEKESNKSDVILPTVDTYSQNHVRTRIVLEKLDKAVPIITKRLRIMPGEFWNDLTCLVKTFRLTQYNISLKPNQWVYTLIILIYFLSLVNSKVKICLEDEQNLTEFNIPLIEQDEDPTLLKTIVVIHP